MNTERMAPLQVLWNYMRLNMCPQKADCIVGFGNYNEDIPLRAAELYHQGYAPKVLFTGGLGRNTRDLWQESEASRFGKIALKAGVPQEDLILEPEATNTAENILFTRKKLEELGLPCGKILGVHKPFMERRIYAAWQVYWPEAELVITSPQVGLEEYIRNSVAQGMTEQGVIDVIVGDFQRISVYARLGYQIPQEIPPQAEEAFRTLVALGCTGELVKEG
jgi:uncharacterized SAM-binding protein YcdF (DUF218 family)